VNTRKASDVTFRICFICSILMAFAVSLPASGGEVARVKTIAGEASIVRLPQEIPAGIDERIFNGDRIRTGADGYLGLTFKDGTLLSMGPESEIVIDEFLFSPAEGKLAFVARILRGAAACLTGVIAKLSPQSVRFETPEATIAVRGTKFLIHVDSREATP
jgi:hypothetical protein